MNKIVVFGANGQTGIEIVKLALKRDIPLRAAVRRRESMEEYADRLDIVEYSFDDPASVRAALKGCDTVMSVIGLGGIKASRQETNLYSHAVRVLREAMREEELDRLLVISSGGVDYDQEAPWYYKHFFRPLLMNSYMDMMKMETILEESPDLQWTIVRPTYLLDGEPGPYRVENRKIGAGNFKIYRTDVADFMLKEAREGKWVHKYPTLGYPK